jgi:hypothetical protein
MLLGAAGSKIFGREDLIASLVTFDDAVVIRSKKLKTVFSSNSILTACRNVWCKVKKSAGMVYKKSASMDFIGSRSPMICRNQSRGSALNLVT